MRRKFIATALAACLALASAAGAAPPTVTSLSPNGAERGKPVTIVISGANLSAKSQLVLPFAAPYKLLPDAKPNPAQVRFEITVPPSVPLGIYPVRLRTDDGLSGLFFFAVDVFPGIQEVEDNSTFEKAQKVPFPVVVSGQCAGGDVDYYRFQVKKGQRVVVETEAGRLGSGVLPQIRVTDSRGRFIAADDTQRLRGDCRTWFIAPEDDDYVVEFSDSRYRGGAPPHYRLKIADYDFAEEIFPLGGKLGEKIEFTLRGGNLTNEVRLRRVLGGAAPAWLHPALRWLDLQGSLKPGMFGPEVAVGSHPEQVYGKDKKGQLVRPPVTVNGRLESRGEVHRYHFPVQAGRRFRFTMEAESLGSYLDGILRVTDQAGKQLARVDDVDLPSPAPGQPPTKTADPALDLTVPAGVTELTVEVRDGLGRGGINFGYRLTIEPSQADFVLDQLVAEVNVPAGSSVLIPVTIRRRDYQGPIQLSMPSLPAGLTAQGGYVPPKALAGILTLTAVPGATFPQPALVSIEGKGLGEGAGFPKVVAEHRLVLSRDGNVAASTMRLGHLDVGLSGPASFRVQGPPTAEVVMGYSTSISVAVTRGAKPVVGAVEVTGVATVPGQPPVPGLTFKPSIANPGTDKAAFTIAANTQALEGRSLDVAIQGKAKIDNKDEVVIGPAIALTVAKPFGLEFLGPAPTLKPGQTVLLKGRLQRQPIFKEPVQLRLDGLPNGLILATPLKPIPANQSDFQFELRADPKAAPVDAKLSLAASTTIAGMAYSHPALIVAAKIQK
jgi:hypothetical protein